MKAIKFLLTILGLLTISAFAFQSCDKSNADSALINMEASGPLTYLDTYHKIVCTLTGE